MKATCTSSFGAAYVLAVEVRKYVLAVGVRKQARGLGSELYHAAAVSPRAFTHVLVRGCHVYVSSVKHIVL